jgi:hypothetical protein
MSATVLLKDIVDALEMQSDEFLSFVDLDTGQVETVSRELLGEAEESDDDDDEPDLPDWQMPEWELAKRIASSDRFVRLPTKFDVHEWEIMREFSDSVESDRIREELLNAIHGAGAFRYFKDTLRRRRMEPAWFAFRTEALAEIARDWCEEHHVEWR